MNEGLSGDEKIWGKLLNTKNFTADKFKRYTGDQVNLERFRKSGLKEPFVIENSAGLDMKMPPNETTVSDIAQAVGEDRPVEVIDVATQSDSTGWTMGKWAEYYNNPDRDRIRNVISLEISGTKFADGITRPKLVRDMDWIDHMWPEDLRPKEYPKVQLYCLMGTKDSYTDFHIDFGGTSVFYHIIRGSKVFYFIEPTTKNLKKYQKWSSSPEQTTTFLGDEVKSCYAVHLKAGNTMIIPTGWIHAVYTPEDALVIGGNFLHGLNIGTQLRIFDIEEATNVPTKFRFPYFKKINWYAAQKYNDILKDAPKTLSTYELQGIMDLARWLQKDVVLLDDDSISGQERRTIRTDIPSSIDDPSALIDNLIFGVEKAISSLGKLKNDKDDSGQHKVVKLKLKLEHKNNNDDEHDRSTRATMQDNDGGTKSNEQLQDDEPNGSSVSLEKQQPKLVLKLKQQAAPPPIADDDDEGDISEDNYILDDHPVEDEEEEDYMTEDSEYHEEDDQDEFKPDATTILPTTTKLSRRRSRSSNVTQPRPRKRPAIVNNSSSSKGAVSDSSSDDDMGTTKRAAGGSSLATKRQPLVKRTKASPTPSTVKQRLLDRFVRR
ncbi:unnamed protein product [Absidia cylindrospora]